MDEVVPGGDGEGEEDREGVSRKATRWPDFLARRGKLLQAEEDKRREEGEVDFGEGVELLEQDWFSS